MQNPVGATYNAEVGRAELVNMFDLITNPFFLVTFPHVIAGAFLLAGGMVIVACGWWFAKGAKMEAAGDPQFDPEFHDTYRAGTRFGAWFVLVASLVSILAGHFQGQVEAKYQPLKLAAAEGVFQSYDNGHAPFALVAFFNADGTGTTWKIDLPDVLSMLVDYKPSTPVLGLDKLTTAQAVTNPDGSIKYLLPPTSDTMTNLQTTLQQSQSFTVTSIQAPNLWVNFYAFRIMVLAGFVLLAFSIIILVKTKEGNAPAGGKAWTALMLSMPLIPLVAASAGWILTEMGRQPYIVYGVLPTSAANSPTVSGGEVFVSMVVYTLIYAVLAVIVVKMFLKTLHEGLPDIDPPEAEPADDDDAVLHFAY
jgi:cytochrome d ubiquinol oxidase subunit I